MSEQPDGVLDEAARLFDSLIRRVAGAGAGGGGRADETAGRAPGGNARDEDTGGVWERAIADEPPPRTGTDQTGTDQSGTDQSGTDQAGTRRPGTPRIATGAPECRDCPVCRAIAIGRESGDDVARHLREAGRSLLAAALDVASAFERTRPTRPDEASPGPRAGRSHRPGTARPDGPWTAATGGGPGAR